jgi:hypothetical protein
MKPLTANERRLLTAYNEPGPGIYARSPSHLVGAGKLPLDSSIQGLHQTAASLVRKGCLERSVRSRITHYQITEKGRAALLPSCPACVPGSTVTAHLCGLAGLQRMLPLGGAR